MGQDYFKNLPSETIMEILSTLPIRTITQSKCVCKSWLHLIETREFVGIHLSKLVPGMVVSGMGLDSSLCKIFDFEDGDDDVESHEFHYNPVTKFNLSFRGILQGSADGLILMRDTYTLRHALYIYNPITRENIKLDCPQQPEYKYPRVSYGFGVSEISGQYKVVRIFYDCLDRETLPHVYTLGTGLWRSIKPGVGFGHIYSLIGGTSLNGNLHWLAHHSIESKLISCFNLETEVFSTFTTPPLPPLPGSEKLLAGLSVLGNSLCLCDNSSKHEIVIWLMKEYGNEKSWTKEFIIKKDADFSGKPRMVIYPTKLFKDGDILMAQEFFNPVYYSNKIKTIKEMDTCELRSPGVVNAIVHTSSFLSLKSFIKENVISF